MSGFSPGIPTKITASMQGQLDNGNYATFASTAEGHLEVAIHGPTLPFGSIHAESLHHQIQIDAVNGINDTLLQITTGTGGNVVIDESRFRLSTTSTIYSYAVLASRKRLRYRPGQGVLGRFTAIFDTPVENLLQLAGFGHSEDGIYFGYNGTSFGILHKHHGKRQIQAFTMSSGSLYDQNISVVLNGITSSVPVTSGTMFKTAYEIAKYSYEGWTVDQTGSNLVFLNADAGAKTGSNYYIIGVSGTFTPSNVGFAGYDEWIPQTQWNGDKLDGSGSSGILLDPLKGNVYQIGIQYLGYGPISFGIETVGVGRNNSSWLNVHTIERPNNFTATTFATPAFPFLATVYSQGSTSAKNMYIGSVYGGIEGKKQLTGPRFSYYTASTSINDSTYNTLFTVRNERVHPDGRANQAVINILSVTAAIKANQPCTIYVIRNAVLVGAPNFIEFSQNSVSAIDTAATSCTFSNDQLLFTTMLGDTGNTEHIFPDELLLQPGESITLAARSVAASPAWVIVGINTREDS